MNSIARGMMQDGESHVVAYYGTLETRYEVEFNRDNVQLRIEHQTETGLEHYLVSMLTSLTRSDYIGYGVTFVARKIHPDYRGIAVFDVSQKKWKKLAERHAGGTGANFFGSTKIRPDATVAHNITFKKGSEKEWAWIFITYREFDEISATTYSIDIPLPDHVLRDIIEHLGVAMFEMEKENAAMRTRA